MAETSAQLFPLGAIAPDFLLFDTASGMMRGLGDLKGEKGTLIMFICNHCPYVLHVKDQLIAIADEYRTKGVATVAISANDIEKYPDDAPDKMQALMAQWGNPFAAYLYDESQEIARAYRAVCTPDLYLFDVGLGCVYRGRLDGSTPKNGVPLTGEDLRGALERLLAGMAPAPEQLPSMGCSIKWR